MTKQNVGNFIQGNDENDIKSVGTHVESKLVEPTSDLLHMNKTHEIFLLRT